MIEEELKSLILERFKSVRAFAVAIDTPYSTINNIFSRGVSGAGISTIIPLCRALNLDVDALADDKIKFKDNILDDLSTDEKELLKTYRNFNDDGKERLLDIVSDMAQLDRYNKNTMNDKTISIYRVARSQDNAEHEIIKDGKSTIDKLSQIPPVTDKEDF